MQAIANESGVNFISVKGPELLNMVGCVCVCVCDWVGSRMHACYWGGGGGVRTLYLC